MGTYLYCRTYKKISINLLSIELILHVMCACYFMYHEVPCYALTNLFGTIQYVSLSKRIYYNKRHYKYDPLCKSLFKRYYPVPSSTQNTWFIYNNMEMEKRRGRDGTYMIDPVPKKKINTSKTKKAAARSFAHHPNY